VDRKTLKNLAEYLECIHPPQIPTFDPLKFATIAFCIPLAAWVLLFVLSAVARLSPWRSKQVPTGVAATTTSIQTPQSPRARAARLGGYVFLFFLGLIVVQAVPHLLSGRTPQPTWIDFLLKKTIAATVYSLVAFALIWTYGLLRRK
jgi:hypothetical protein